MFNFIKLLFSLLKEIYFTCAIHIQVDRQASVARISFYLQDSLKYYPTLPVKSILTHSLVITKKNNITTIPAPSPLHILHNNHYFFLVPQNFRNTLSTTERMLRSSNLQRILIFHIALEEQTIDYTYKQIKEQPYSLTSQNNHLFGPR